MIVLRADVLRSEIARRNLSQAEFARRLGSSEAYLSLLLNGHKEPGPTIREKLMKLLGLSFEDLFAFKEPARR